MLDTPTGTFQGCDLKPFDSTWISDWKQKKIKCRLFERPGHEERVPGHEERVQELRLAKAW